MKKSVLQKLDQLLDRHEELAALLSDADTINNQDKFRSFSIQDRPAPCLGLKNFERGIELVADFTHEEKAIGVAVLVSGGPTGL